MNVAVSHLLFRLCPLTKANKCYCCRFATYLSRLSLFGKSCVASIGVSYMEFVILSSSVYREAFRAP